ncbi:hypothetical protein N8834_00740 [bacterium]|nr:hypothetical protein [bacterium]
MSIFEKQTRKDVYTHLFLFVSVLVFANQMLAQNKLEKEYRLPIKEVPVKAIAFVDSLEFKNKVKWYMEIGMQEKSVEAKASKDRQKYSIEFDIEGRLQDIEIEKKWMEIPSLVREKIVCYLDTIFKKNTIQKIQVQYSGTNKNLWSLLTNQIKTVPYKIKYELIVKGSFLKERELYEFLFSEKGDFEKKTKIIFRSTDNLEF